jgi:protein tyrosine/serine phosphatase
MDNYYDYEAQKELSNTFIHFNNLRSAFIKILKIINIIKNDDDDTDTELLDNQEDNNTINDKNTESQFESVEIKPLIDVIVKE